MSHFICALLAAWISFMSATIIASKESTEKNKPLKLLITECQKSLPRDVLCELTAKVVK